MQRRPVLGGCWELFISPGVRKVWLTKRESQPVNNSPSTQTRRKAWSCYRQTCYLWRQRDREGRGTMGRFIFLALGLLVVAFSLNGTGADHPCPLDWFSFEHFCYKLIKQRKPWADAETFCVQQQNGSHLASIQSWAESAYLAKVVSTNVLFTGVWIGLSDPEKKGTWEWSDGSRLGYTSWERREPNNRDNKEYCVELSRWSGYLGWKDVNCESQRFFVCKLQPKSVGSS